MCFRLRAPYPDNALGEDMINRFRLLRNIGQFDNVAATNHALQRLTLLYAENGRGKTTLSALFRSLAQNRPDLILERHRLAAAHPPEVIIDCVGGPQPAMFQNGAWNRHLPNLTVFDDVFVDENVCSGLSVDAEHRQNLHELIIGAQGVALNQQLQAFVTRIEAHNTELRARAAAVPPASMGSMTIDAFCALQPRPTIDADIQEAERALQAAREQTPIREARPFEAITLPAFDIAAIEQVLALDLQSLDTAAVARVQEHLSQMPAGSEAWVADGMRRIPTGGKECPFCAQDMTASPVLTHYRTFFGEEYRNLKESIGRLARGIDETHSDNGPISFERALRLASERRMFWARFDGGANGSPSIQVKEADIDAAVSEGFRRLTKDTRNFNQGRILTMRAALLPAYLQSSQELLMGNADLTQAQTQSNSSVKVRRGRKCLRFSNFSNFNSSSASCSSESARWLFSTRQPDFGSVNCLHFAGAMSISRIWSSMSPDQSGIR
jgi:hypothetical protein